MSGNNFKDWVWDPKTGNFVKRDEYKEVPVDVTADLYVKTDTAPAFVELTSLIKDTPHPYVEISDSSQISVTYDTVPSAPNIKISVPEPPEPKAILSTVACPKCGGRPIIITLNGVVSLSHCKIEVASGSLQESIRKWNEQVELLNAERLASGWQPYHDSPVLVRPLLNAELQRALNLNTVWWPSLTVYNTLSELPIYQNAKDLCLAYRNTCDQRVKDSGVTGTSEWDEGYDPDDTKIAEKLLRVRTENVVAFNKLAVRLNEMEEHSTRTVEHIITGSRFDWNKALKQINEQAEESAKAFKEAASMWKIGEEWYGAKIFSPWDFDIIEREFAIAYHIDSADEIRIPADVALWIVKHQGWIGEGATILSPEELEDIRIRALTVKENFEHGRRKYRHDRTANDGTLLVPVALVPTTNAVLEEDDE